MRWKTGVIAFAVLVLQSLPLGAEGGNSTNEAQRLYRTHQESVCQVRVVDLATGKKSSIGSGFRIDDAGRIATNFHVVSQAVHAPERFRVEAMRDGAVLGEMKVLGIDVIHDLAVASGPAGDGPSLELGRSDLSKGMRLFTLGNPLDLGMTIVEGTYNGLMERSLYRKILFSGSLNPGMSGGPALDREGLVVGVNVSTAGNDVSFLVPVEYLLSLYEKVVERGAEPPEDWDKVVEGQLLENQDSYMDEILSSAWDALPIGGATVPGEILEAIKCWGESHDEEHDLYQHADIYCSVEEGLFLSGSHSTGEIAYNYSWVTSKDLDLFRFYSLHEDFFGGSVSFHNAGEEEVENFQCTDKFVSVAGRPWKAVLCARSYERYPALYDLYLAMASVDEVREGLLVEMQVLGVSREKALAFAGKFMGEIRWEEQ